MTTATGTQVVLTPTPGRVLRRSLFWIGGGLFALLVAVITLSVAGSTAEGQSLDSANPAPGGSMALAEVLRQQGVDVIATSTLAETESAIGDADDTTLFVFDSGPYLSDDQVRDAIGLAGSVVLADPSFAALRVAAPELAQAGFVEGVLDARCDLDAAAAAGTVSGAGSGYRVIEGAGTLTSCFPSGDDVYSLVQLQRDAAELTILGATDALTNGTIAADGNAALGLRLLGENDTLVWYLPSLDDVPASGDATLAELTPPWVISVLVLLFLTFIVAAVWRGRRFGPLVVENLPVTVRASETMLGRARLYERSSSRLRALDSLRIGAIQRLAKLCGLPRVASVDEVIAAVASVTGAQVADIRRLLVDADPATDADLVALSDGLLTLERDVAVAVRP